MLFCSFCIASQKAAKYWLAEATLKSNYQLRVETFLLIWLIGSIIHLFAWL
jgi:hypothetical protein